LPMWRRLPILERVWPCMTASTRAAGKSWAEPAHRRRSLRLSTRWAPQRRARALLRCGRARRSCGISWVGRTARAIRLGYAMLVLGTTGRPGWGRPTAPRVSKWRAVGSSTEELEDRLRRLIGLGQNRLRRLLEDGLAGKGNHFGGHVGVTNAALGGARILLRNAET
jgi:hypothetical protein